jgi:hypothetical protein
VEKSRKQRLKIPEEIEKNMEIESELPESYQRAMKPKTTE